MYDHIYYDQGWNDYIKGIKPDFTKGFYTSDYKDGWQDCQEATAAYGEQKEI